MIRPHSMILCLLFSFSGIALANTSAQNMKDIAVAAAEHAQGSQAMSVKRVRCHYETATFCVSVSLYNGKSCLVDMANYLSPNGGVEADPEVFACH